MSVLCIICARGGSVGIKNKALIKINGKPLIWYTLKEAKKSKYIDNYIVSSDSNKIINVVKKFGIDVLMTPWIILSSDKKIMIPVDSVITIVEPIEGVKKMFLDKNQTVKIEET